MYLNKAIIIGRLTRDPELKAMPSGAKVANFSIATNRTWKDKDGAKQEAVEFHNIVAFGGTGELCAQYLRKGSEALVEGRIQTRSWDDVKSGDKRYRTEIVADSVQFGAKAKNDAGGAQGGEATIDAETGEQRPATRKPAGGMTPAVVPAGAKTDDSQIEYPTDDINPDDIPF